MNKRESLHKEYQEISDKYWDICKKVQDYHEPIIKAAIKTGDMEKAKEAINDCPDAMGRAYGFDAMRQAGMIDYI